MIVQAVYNRCILRPWNRYRTSTYHEFKL